MQRLEHGEEEEETAAEEKEKEDASSAMEVGGAHLQHWLLLNSICSSTLFPKGQVNPILCSSNFLINKLDSPPNGIYRFN